MAVTVEVVGLTDKERKLLEVVSELKEQLQTAQVRVERLEKELSEYDGFILFLRKLRSGNVSARDLRNFELEVESTVWADWLNSKLRLAVVRKGEKELSRPAKSLDDRFSIFGAAAEAPGSSSNLMSSLRRAVELEGHKVLSFVHSDSPTVPGLAHASMILASGTGLLSIGRFTSVAKELIPAGSMLEVHVYYKSEKDYMDELHENHSKSSSLNRNAGT